MADELDALLEQAKRNLSGFEDSDDELEAVKAIPKLQSVLKQDKPPAELAQAEPARLKLKALPSRTKTAKPETAGAKWFDMGRPEMTPALKRDLELLKMRHVLDPKRFYKKESTKTPKFFSVGTIKEDPTEYFSARMTRKQRKQTLAEEILATRPDYFKSKYKQIQAAKTSGRKRHYKQIRDRRA